MSVKGSLNVRLFATISSTWSDYEVPGYVEMTLKIGQETSDPWELRARYETTQEPAVDASYDVSGELFYDPGQRWSSGSKKFTYVLIRSLIMLSCACHTDIGQGQRSAGTKMLCSRSPERKMSVHISCSASFKT